MLPMLLGLAVPLIQKLAGKFMGEGMNLVSSAITGGGKKAKEFIEEKTGLKLDDPDKLSALDLQKIKALETHPDFALKLRELSLEILKEENRHDEQTEKNWSELISILNTSDATGNSTRPKIAMVMTYMMAFSVMIFSGALAYAIFTSSIETIKQLNDAWPLMLAIMATPTALLRSYFGMRTKEKKARYDLVSDYEMEPSLIKGVLGALKK